MARNNPKPTPPPPSTPPGPRKTDPKPLDPGHTYDPSRPGDGFPK